MTAATNGVIALVIYACFYFSLLWFCVIKETTKTLASIWDNGRTYLLCTLRIFDLASDLGVVVAWAGIASTERNIGPSELNVQAIFLSALFMFFYHRCMTAYGIYTITSSSDRGWLQLCDCNTFSAMYYSIARWQSATHSTTTFRWILRMGAVLESFPFAVLQLIFLIKGAGHAVDPLVRFSLFLSCLSLIIVFVVDDTDNVVESARVWYFGPDWKEWDRIQQNWQFSLRIIFRVMDSLSRTWILSFIWIAAGGATFLLLMVIEFAVAFSMAVCPLVCTESFDFISIMTVMPFDKSVRHSPLCTCYGLCNPASNYSERVFSLRYTVTFLELVIGFGLSAELVYYTASFYSHFVFCWVSYTFAMVTFILWVRDLVNPLTIEIRNVFAYTRDNQDGPLRQILEFGGILHIVDDLGQTPLHIAAAENTQKSLKVLIDLNVPVDAQDLRGYTALMVAIEQNHFEIGEKLIAAGSNPTVREYQDNMHAFGLIRLKQTTKKKWRKILDKNDYNIKYRDEFPKQRESAMYDVDEFEELSEFSESDKHVGVVIVGREDSHSSRSRNRRKRTNVELSVGTNSRSSKRD